VINPNPGDHRIAHKIAARNKISARSCNLKLHQTKGKIKKIEEEPEKSRAPLGTKTTTWQQQSHKHIILQQ